MSQVANEPASDWYAAVREYTLRLVRIASVSPGTGERAVAEEALRILREGGLSQVYTASGLDSLSDDAHHRANAYAFLRGRSPDTIVLLGHIDTVGTEDYGALQPYALDPETLAAHQAELAARTPELRDVLDRYPGDVMLGRGVADMKSGVAINLAVMRHLARDAQSGSLPLSVVVLATPDEENESAGVLQAVRFLLRLREEHGLRYLGAINTDTILPRYPGDPHRYMYSGTIGKLLPSFLVVGREAHVGTPFAGVDANLIVAELVRDLSMNPDLCDVVRGQATPPPVTLHAADLKARYDVQLPFAASFYLNVLTFTTGPAELLEKLRTRATTALQHVLARLDDAEWRWQRMAAEGPANAFAPERPAAAKSASADSEQAGRDTVGARPVPPAQSLAVETAAEGVAPHRPPARTHTDRVGTRQASPTIPRFGIVTTYADLYKSTAERLGEAHVRQELAAEAASLPAEADARERSLRLIHRLWTLSDESGPAVVLYYSPPYYPHAAASAGPLLSAVQAVAGTHPNLQLRVEEFYPYISDMSFLRLEPGVDLTALEANLPQWPRPGEAPLPGSYSLPLDAIRALDLPFVDLGPFGGGVHQRGEWALASYSFGVVPQLVYEIIAHLAKSSRN